jgi:uncharacterized protein
LITIVAHTNVLISAILFGGNPQKILEKVLSNDISLILSRQILEEFEGVLCGKKFNYPPDVASAIAHEVELIAQILAPKRHIVVIQADPDDNMVLECAIAGKADYIVSGDAHLLDLKEFEAIRIVTPAEFLKALEDLHE